MAEKFVENQFCRACGAGIRQGALFCYTCGTSVAQDLAVETEAAKDEGVAKNFRLRQGISEGKNENNSPNHVGTIEKPFDKPIEKPSDAPIVVANNDGLKDKKTDVQRAAGLNSAAAIRQKSRSAEVKNVEVVWEAPESSANVWFFVVSIILTILAVGMLLLMLYIR